MKYYYGFEFADGRNTTTGIANTDPGRFNGRLSIAGEGKIFTSKKQRDDWVQNGNRTACTKSELRRYCKGQEKSAWNEYVKQMIMITEEPVYNQ